MGPNQEVQTEINCSNVYRSRKKKLYYPQWKCSCGALELITLNVKVHFMFNTRLQQGQSSSVLANSVSTIYRPIRNNNFSNDSLSTTPLCPHIYC